MDIIDDTDVHNAPMPEQHKQMILKHLQRLQDIAKDEDVDSGEREVCKKRADIKYQKRLAREQLARITTVFRRYQARHERGEFEDEEVESMCADIIDGCILVYNTRFLGKMPAAGDRLMDEDQDGAAELWNPASVETAILPDCSRKHDIGEDLELHKLMLKNKRSEGNLVELGRAQVPVPSGQWPKIREELLKKSPVYHHWPPTPAEGAAYVAHKGAEPEEPESDWEEYLQSRAETEAGDSDCEEYRRDG